MRSHQGLLALGALALVALVASVLLWPTPSGASAEDVAAVVLGSASNHTCALTTAGDLKCWGRNDYSQLGDGTFSDSTRPLDVEGLGGSVLGVATGRAHTCALTTAGGVKCWGRNESGQLGDGTFWDRTTPVDVVGLGSGVVAVTTGFAHSCAVTTEDSVKCWGNNYHAQLGHAGFGQVRATPVDVPLASDVVAVAAGDWHTCAVTTVGGVKCWGENLHGQLGNGMTGLNASAPVNVSGLASGVVSVAAGGLHTCVLLTNAGGVKCWGGYCSGELGDGTTTSRSTPVDVVGLASDAAAISAGGNHACVLTAAGGAKCWGSNGSGQLGDGATTDRTTPVDVVGLTSGVTAIAAGGVHTCAVTSAGGAKCWGFNGNGRLGDGTTTQRTAPVDVVGLGPTKPTPTPTPPATATPTSGPVGGIAELPELAGIPLETSGSSGRRAGVLAAVVAGASVALGGAAWRARRGR